MWKVSLIVPVYNAEPWFDECMASIRAQTYKEVELIVIDDSEGTGAAAARNRGLDKAKGEFIAFCDADDYLMPDAIEKMVEAMDGVDMVCGSFRKFGDFEEIVQHPDERLSRKKVAQYVMENLNNPRHNQMLSGCWAKMYRRDIVGRFPLLTTAEDMAFNFDYLTRCKSVRFIEDVVYHNRKHQGSLTTTYDEKDRMGLFGVIEALRYVETFLARHYYGYTVSRALDNSKVYHAMLYFSRIMQQTGETPHDTLMRLYP